MMLTLGGNAASFPPQLAFPAIGSPLLQAFNAALFSNAFAASQPAAQTLPFVNGGLFFGGLPVIFVIIGNPALFSAATQNQASLPPAPSPQPLPGALQPALPDPTTGSEQGQLPLPPFQPEQSVGPSPTDSAAAPSNDANLETVPPPPIPEAQSQTLPLPEPPAGDLALPPPAGQAQPGAQLPFSDLSPLQAGLLQAQQMAVPRFSGFQSWRRFGC